LKHDSEMANLNYNIPTTNDGEQHKDANNNIKKYLEFNKDSVSDLPQKNYEKLIEALTNDSNSNAAASSSNPSLSQPWSSSTIPMLFFIYTFYKTWLNDLHWKTLILEMK
jgi:hypothetical protein